VRVRVRVCVDSGMGSLKVCLPRPSAVNDVTRDPRVVTRGADGCEAADCWVREETSTVVRLLSIFVFFRYFFYILFF